VPIGYKTHVKIIHSEISICLKKENSILKALAYFSLFSYPITKEEIQLFLDHKISTVELLNSLTKLKNSKLVFQLGNFYSLTDNHDLYERRIKGNAHAASLLITAYKISKFLYKFPFVRGVCISGSLSKNFADEHADIDFFIITKAGRLWLARTLMHVYKKFTFLAGKQHWYCMNYFIDEEALMIDEKNEFTAVEITTLLPACGGNAIPDFFNMNEWVNTYYPNYLFKNFNPTIEGKDNKAKKIIEALFNNQFGNWLDTYFMKLTKRRWEQKENELKLNKNGQRIGLKIGKHFCKPNPEFLQKKILSCYESKLEELAKKCEEIFKEERSAFLN